MSEQDFRQEGVGPAGSDAGRHVTLAFCDQHVRVRYPVCLHDMIEMLFGALRSDAVSVGHEVVVVAGDDGRFAITRDGEPSTDGLSRVELSAFLMEKVMWSLVADIDQTVALHAGAVAWNGKAILIPGRTGVGKSSLTAWFVAHGFEYLSDETAALTGPPTGIVGLSRAIVSKGKAADELSRMSGFGDMRSVVLDDAEVAWATPSAAGSQRQCGLIVFPRYVPGSDLALSVATPAQAALGLMECNLNARNLRDGGMAAVVALARAVPAVVMAYGDFRQLDGAIDVLARCLLDDVRDAAAARRLLSLVGGKATAGPEKVVPAERFPIPAATPRGAPKKLTIGMATYDDYDGVYFSIQALRMYHPEINDQIEFLVVDNHPDGPCSAPLKALEHHIPNYRYVPIKGRRGTAVRQSVFDEASGEFVLCIDCHVFIAPGGVQRLLDYFDAHPDTPDLLQGPLLADGLDHLVASHLAPEWRSGFFGTWQIDDRAKDVDAAPFEIPSQGLGLFACRRAAWLGFNPAFRGFGGEEGYIQEKFRRAGARTLCLPFLRWMHRFNRPMGLPYVNLWDDRVHNYLVGFREVGLSTDGVVDHFRTVLGGAADEMFERIGIDLDETPATAPVAGV